MNEDALRALVRETIARHLGPGLKAGATENHRFDVTPGFGPGLRDQWQGHASHVRLEIASGEDLDGPCLIEPTVRCNHCGYCQSVGH
jgi:hypothetical protein